MCYINYFTVLFAPPPATVPLSLLSREAPSAPPPCLALDGSVQTEAATLPSDYRLDLRQRQGDSLYSHSTHSPGRCSSGLVSAACGTDAENAHGRLLGQMYLVRIHGILGALSGLEKLIPETVSAPLQLSTPDPCLTDSLTPPSSNIYSVGTGTEAFLSLPALTLQQTCLCDANQC